MSRLLRLVLGADEVGDEVAYVQAQRCLEEHVPACPIHALHPSDQKVVDLPKSILNFLLLACTSCQTHYIILMARPFGASGPVYCSSIRS